MKCNAKGILSILACRSKWFAVPIYQRKYSWKNTQCRRLYNDLKKIVKETRESHFFGSIVTEVVPMADIVKYIVIDGQQRITTITLLLLAIRNLITQEKIFSNGKEGRKLDEYIYENFLNSDGRTEEEKIKLKPKKEEQDAFCKLLVGDERYFDMSSNLTANYQFFCDLVLETVVEKKEMTVDDLYSAVEKLEIIFVTLESSDSAQLIFETLNSTGLALTEGDKIRNYVLMDLKPKAQEYFYNKYWKKIEECTENNVGIFVRDYLSIKQKKIPAINNVYWAFKGYVTNKQLKTEELLKDLELYAEFFYRLIPSGIKAGSGKLDKCMYRLRRYEVSVARPFLMAILRYQMDKKLSEDEVFAIFRVTESYVFRRNICGVPTNSLNKIFLNLDAEIIRYEENTENYLEKFIFALLTKKGNARFPDNKEFRSCFAVKDIYRMRSNHKAYLFERLENGDSNEENNVYGNIDAGIYSIEHIMPQHLTDEWQFDLGETYKEIHKKWLNRLANLTITGYNSEYSNARFITKRDMPNGYKESGLRLTKRLGELNAWGETEMENRNNELLDSAEQLWLYPETKFKPPAKPLESCSLNDEDVEVTDRKLVKYSYQNEEQPVHSWIDMFERVVRTLHWKDKRVLSNLANGANKSNLSTWIRNNAENLDNAKKIDEGVFIGGYTNTLTKLRILRNLFKCYEVDPEDLIFYFEDSEKKEI